MGVVNDPLRWIRSGLAIFEKFTAIFGMCSLEVLLFASIMFLIRLWSFLYHKMFLKKFTKK